VDGEILTFWLEHEVLGVMYRQMYCW